MKRRHTKYWTLTRWQTEVDKGQKLVRIRQHSQARGTFRGAHVPGRLLATSKLRNKR